MVLKAVLFDFNGVILDDEPIHEFVIQDLLVAENLRPSPDDFRQYCLGRSDRAALIDLFQSRGRILADNYLNQLIQKKAIAYRAQLSTLETLPLFEGASDLIRAFKDTAVKIGIVSGALRADIETTLERSNLAHCVDVIVSADDVLDSKPHPAGYLKALESLGVSAHECLVLEDTFVGIKAAKAAHIPVVGVAHTFPFHMLQRCTNWTIDYLNELEVSRVQAVYAGERYPTDLDATA